ncbi:ArsC/Spx/MgsR family protein [Nafulsella turpanensis]|uniref:ArsC/Spx/MgsR family protein n=1 Tax=Nafulsella turpanensis TaxID=1265690 RepID=UPI000349DA7F|nr:ArsC/Spx/MgsR family protein [Nafulsella turpanensis]
MEYNKREAIIYWNPDVKRDKNTYNLVKQLTEHINDIDVRKNMPNSRQLIEMLDKLGRRAQDLVDKGSTTYKEKFSDVELSEEEWLKALVANPEMLYTPIVFLGDRGMIVDTPSRVLDLDPTHGFNDFQV